MSIVRVGNGEKVFGYFGDCKVTDAVQYCIDREFVKSGDVISIQVIDVVNIDTVMTPKTTISFEEKGYDFYEDQNSYTKNYVGYVNKVLTTEEHNAIVMFERMTKEEQEAIRKYIVLEK